MSVCYPSSRNNLQNYKQMNILVAINRNNLHCVPKKVTPKFKSAYLIRITYPLSSFNYHLSNVNVVNFNKIHRTVSEQQLF